MCLNADFLSPSGFFKDSLSTVMIIRALQFSWVLCSLVIFLSAASVYGDWMAVEKDYLDPQLRTVYIDPDTIRREEAEITVWQLTDYKMMQGGVGFGRFMLNPNRFFSVKTLKQLDCERKQIRLLEDISFRDHMATGTASHSYVDPTAWLPIEPKSVNYALWEFLCAS